MMAKLLLYVTGLTRAATVTVQAFNYAHASRHTAGRQVGPMYIHFNTVYAL